MEKENKVLTKEEIEAKLKKFGPQLLMWRDRHGDKPPPLWFDHKTDEFHWVNREQRRRKRKK